MTSHSEPLASEELDIHARDCFERVVSELQDNVAEPYYVAMAILELIRAEIVRINATGKVRP